MQRWFLYFKISRPKKLISQKNYFFSFGSLNSVQFQSQWHFRRFIFLNYFGNNKPNKVPKNIIHERSNDNKQNKIK